MADIDYEPVVSPEEEEERRRKEGDYPPVPPISVPQSATKEYGPPAPDVPPVVPVSTVNPSAPPVKMSASPTFKSMADMAPVPSVGGPQRPQWKDYAPPEPHGWSKFGHIMASFSKPLNDYFNVRPEKEAEEKYKAATSEYEAPFKEEQETATTGEANAKAEESKAHADALRNPQPKEGVTPEEKTIHDLMTGENGGPRVNPQTGKPYSYMEAYTAVKQAAQDTKPDKTPNDFDQFLSDWLKDRNAPDNAHNRLLARKEWATAGQAPQHDPRQMIVGPDNKVIELKPGMTVPDGSKTVNGELTHKPSADEQKRADLVENLNENLDQLEDIVNRRPDLFGKIAGRTTKAKEWLGSDDPDIAALKGIEDRLGMVQQSSHGMRSAQHVEASANSLLNGFKNGADAMKRAISDARNSGKTFTEDAQRAKGEKVPEHAKPKDLGAAPEGSKEGRTGTLPDGTKVVVKGGRLVAQ